MMPQCDKRRCKNVAKKCVGKIIIPGDEDGWENPIYLCEKHTQEFIKKYGVFEWLKKK